MFALKLFFILPNYFNKRPSTCTNGNLIVYAFLSNGQCMCSFVKFQKRKMKWCKKRFSLPTNLYARPQNTFLFNDDYSDK